MKLEIEILIIYFIFLEVYIKVLILKIKKYFLKDLTNEKI